MKCAYVLLCIIYRALARGTNIPEHRRQELFQTLIVHYGVDEVTVDIISQACQIDTRYVHSYTYICL